MGKIKIVAFKLGEEEYGLDIHFVQSIEKIQHMTRVPNAPEYVEGVINLRGNVTPVIDLSRRLDLKQTAHSENTRVIITKYEELELGFMVDQVNDVMDVSTDSIEPASSNDMSAAFFEGIAKSEGRLIILLNPAELMLAPSS